jgi:hypothetical protein
MGRPDQGNESWDRERLTAARLAALNGRATSQGTGKHRAISTSTGEYRAIPQRPPSMPQHLNSPPEIPRVARPQRPTTSRSMRPRLIILGAIATIIAIFVFVIFSLLVSAINQSTGPAMTATHFLSSLSSSNYKDAYQDLGPGVTIRLNQDDFTKQMGNLDGQYGAITDYTEVDGSATVKNNTQSFAYTITRAKLSKPYQLTLTLQQNPNDNNTWKIVDYGQTLGPPQP